MNLSINNVSIRYINCTQFINNYWLVIWLTDERWCMKTPMLLACPCREHFSFDYGIEINDRVKKAIWYE